MGLLDTRTLPPDSGEPNKPHDTLRNFPASRAVPGYEIEEELGRGGMGVVYRARQVSLNRTVALKMLLAGGHAGSEGLARFHIEAKAVARLQHPNIVQIHEVGEHDGLAFISLEFCQGDSLHNKLRRDPLSLKESAALVELLARAMHHAHTQGIVHRDLKPSNVLMSEGGIPKITDFGLAKKLGEDGGGQTHSGDIMGTPSYMAPEQAAGKREIGPWTDVYGLGAILLPESEELPDEMAALPRQSGIPYRHDYFDEFINKLVKYLRLRNEQGA